MTFIKKTLLFILFTFNLLSTIYGQTSKGWGASLSCNFSGRILDFSNTPFNEFQIQNIRDVETVRTGAALNLFGWYQTAHWYFKLGVGYNYWSGFQSKKFIIPPGKHSIAPNSTLKQEFYKAKQVYFPLNASYIVPLSEKNKLLLGTEVALVWNTAFNHHHYHYNNYSKPVLSDFYLRPLPEYSVWDLYIGASVGFQTQLSKKYQMVLEPYFRYFINQYNTRTDKITWDYLYLNDATKGNLFHAGLSVSLLRSL